MGVTDVGDFVLWRTTMLRELRPYVCFVQAGDTRLIMTQEQYLAGTAGADDPNDEHWIEYIPADLCAACGHDRCFHQIGTGHGVPLGVEFCDDRHGPECNCIGFEPRY